MPPFPLKKGYIPYYQALRLNRISSETNSFDKRTNDLERFLLERGDSSKLVRKGIFQKTNCWTRKRAKEMIAS